MSARYVVLAEIQYLDHDKSEYCDVGSTTLAEFPSRLDARDFVQNLPNLKAAPRYYHARCNGTDIDAHGYVNLNTGTASPDENEPDTYCNTCDDGSWGTACEVMTQSDASRWCLTHSRLYADCRAEATA